MANQRRRQTNEPWKRQAYNRENRVKEGSGHSQHKKRSGAASTAFLTVLVVLFFAVIAGMIMFTVWNNRNPDMQTVKASFYGGSNTKSSANSSNSASQSAASSQSTPSSSSEEAGTTYTISAQDSTMTALEANTKMTWAELCQLNKNLDPNNPGKNSDGSWIYVGEKLKVK